MLQWAGHIYMYTQIYIAADSRDLTRVAHIVVRVAAITSVLLGSRRKHALLQPFRTLQQGAEPRQLRQHGIALAARGVAEQSHHLRVETHTRRPGHRRVASVPTNAKNATFTAVSLKVGSHT